MTVAARQKVIVGRLTVAEGEKKKKKRGWGDEG